MSIGLLSQFFFILTEEGKGIIPLQDNGLDSLSSERQGAETGAGVWIGVGAGVLLVLFMIAGLFYFKMYVK